MHKRLTPAAYPARQYKLAMMRFFRTQPQGATLNEAVQATGLNKEWVEYTLRQMLAYIPARLYLTPTQEVVWQFDFTKARHRTQEYLREGILWLAQLLMYVFKLWIGLMLVSYFLVNTVILIVALLILTVASEGVLLEILAQALSSCGYEIGNKQNESESHNTPLPKVNTNRGWFNQVFAYVFGDAASMPPPDTRVQDCLQQIQANHGTLHLAEIIQITGLSLRDAQEFATRLMANYEGDAQVNAAGQLVYLFPDMVVSDKFAFHAARVWERTLPTLCLNNNSRRANRFITLLNAFNMLMAGGTTLFFAQYLYAQEAMPAEIWWFSLWIPLVFSTIFFLIPIGRFFWLRRINQRHQYLNQKHTLLESMCAQPDKKVLNPKEILRLLPTLGTNYAVAQRLLKHIFLSLEADIHLTPQGDIYYSCDALATEE